MEIKSGALLGRGKYDFQAGANSPLVHQVLLESADWKELSIPNEIQIVDYGKDNQFDSSMCVSFNGVCKPIQYILMQMLRLNLVPQETVLFLKAKYFKNGKIDFAERFPAVKGETSANGAYQYKVANAAKNFGLIPQDMFPMADSFEENINPSFITPAMEALGKEFLTHFAINYEWVNPEDTEEFKKYSPLGCIGQYANKVGDEILNPPTAEGHAMAEVKETDTYREIDDSYFQQFKKYNKGKLQSFMAFYLTPLKTKNMFNAGQFLKDHDTFQVRNTNTGAYGVIYHNTAMLITPERAGLYLIDRDARGLLGKGQALTINLASADWDKLDWSKNF